jgi:hypothetical protein
MIGPEDAARILGADLEPRKRPRPPTWILAIAVFGLIIAIGILAAKSF